MGHLSTLLPASTKAWCICFKAISTESLSEGAFKDISTVYDRGAAASWIQETGVGSVMKGKGVMMMMMSADMRGERGTEEVFWRMRRQ